MCVCSGPDRVIMKMESVNNEVEQFLNSRYISAAEGVWKLLNLPITDRSHAVVKLACHLPDQHSLIYQEGMEEEALVRGQLHTTLTSWFETNRLNESAWSFLYPDFPEHYVYKDHQWTKRKQGFGKTIGRIPSVPLNSRSMESYSLRLILHNRAGATCYSDLLTVDNVEHPTFHAAAIAMGLMDDKAELDKTMDEAVTIQSGENVRKLFLSILLYCRPSDPPKFWQNHKQKLYEDWLRNCSVEYAENKALLWLEEHLLPLEMDLASYGLPLPGSSSISSSKELAVIAEERNYNPDDEKRKYEHKLQLMTDEQRKIFFAVKEAIDGDGGMFAIDAPGETWNNQSCNFITNLN